MPDKLAAQRTIAVKLIVLTLIADGQLASREIEAIDRHRIAELLGVERDALIQAVIDHCRGLLERPSAGDTVRVAELERTEHMLERITDPELQKLTCRAMLVLSKSDGTITLAEQTLLRHALTRWGLTLDSVSS
jgi:hypothetical protein